MYGYVLVSKYMQSQILIGELTYVHWGKKNLHFCFCLLVSLLGFFFGGGVYKLIKDILAWIITLHHHAL